MAKPGALERGYVRVKLIRELALGELTQAELARRYDVSAPAMTKFVQRHAERIAEVASKLDDQFAGIAFADKVNRVAELSADVESIAELLADPETAASAGVQYAEMVNSKRATLRAIADELGQIPARVQVAHSGSLDVRINGVDLGALT